MFVAHAFDADGVLVYTRGGFTSALAAGDAAKAARAARNQHGAGGWAVVEATMTQYAAWALGDHSQPVGGIIVHSGGPAAPHPTGIPTCSSS